MPDSTANEQPKTVSMSMISNLPASLSCSILRDWLRMKSVIALDSAHCCKSSREHFTDLLGSEEFYIQEQIVVSNHQSGLANNLIALKEFGEKFRNITFDQNALSSAQGSAVVEHCQNLTHLTFQFMESCTPELWGLLRTNLNLESLSVFTLHYYKSDSSVTMPSFAGIRLPGLKSLAITGFRCNHGKILEAMRISGNIVHLDLSGAVLRPTTLLEIAPLCPCLTSLGLANTVVSDEVLYHLTKTCPYIQHLDLSGNNIEVYSSLTDDGILAVVQNLKGLKSLNIKNNVTLTDESLVHIYTHCANTLHTLHMDCSDDIDNEFAEETELFDVDIVNELLVRCKELRTLHFAYLCVDVEAEVDIVFPESLLHNITTLVLSGNIVCERTLKAIGEHATKLEILSLDQVSVLSESSLNGIYEGCRKLKELYIDLSSEEQCEFSKIRTFISRSKGMWMDNRPGLIVGKSVPPHLDFKCFLSTKGSV